MKYLQVFENQNIKRQKIWVAIYVPDHGTQKSIKENTEPYLFETKEDMENFILDYINSEIESYVGSPADFSGYIVGQDYEIDEDGNKFFVNYDVAMDWDWNKGGSNWMVYRRFPQKNIPVSPKVKFYRDAKNYNL
jgi:hypothetical protein